MRLQGTFEVGLNAFFCIIICQQDFGKRMESDSLKDSLIGAGFYCFFSSKISQILLNFPL